LRSAGKYSYAMYVFHFPISKLLGTRLLGPAASAHSATIAVLYAAAVTVVTYLCAALSYHLYEQRFLRLKRYFVPTPARLAEAICPTANARSRAPDCAPPRWERRMR